MNRRIVVIEPDATIRRMMERVLSAAGFAPSAVATIDASRPVLDAEPTLAAIVELRAGTFEGAEAVRRLRADYPEIPLIVTGTLLTTRVLQELLRAHVDDVVPKPFSPRELVDALERVLREHAARADGALEYAAAMSAARRAIVEGRLGDAESPLSRARAVSPLDGESVALFALLRELQGADHDAGRAYRAALALAGERVTEDASPTEGLARLSAYRGARVVAGLERCEGADVWMVGDAVEELSLGPPAKGNVVTVFALGLAKADGGAAFARLSDDGRRFLVVAGTLCDRLGTRVLRALGAARIVGYPRTLARLGIAPESDSKRLP